MPALKPALSFVDANFDEYMASILGDKPIARFGLWPVNDLLGGVFAGQIVGLGAQPSSGKTSLMIQLADELALQDVPVLFVSGELPPYKLIWKSLVRLSNGCLDLASVSRLAEDSGLAEAFSSATEAYRRSIAPNLAIVGDVTAQELGKLIAECLTARDKLPVVFIDYLQLLATHCLSPMAEERLAIASYMRELRDVANAYNVPIFLISTITRSTYSKKNPDLSLFGGAAIIEYSLDAALYLYSEDEKNSLGTLPALQLRALKNRYGTTGAVRLLFDADHATFYAGE